MRARSLETLELAQDRWGIYCQRKIKKREGPGAASWQTGTDTGAQEQGKAMEKRTGIWPEYCDCGVGGPLYCGWGGACAYKRFALLGLQ